MEEQKMTELSFLISLILDDDLPPKHKKLCADRIKDMEQGMMSSTKSYPQNPPSYPQGIPRALADNGPAGPVAETAAAQNALQARAEAMSKAGKIEPGRTAARKF